MRFMFLKRVLGVGVDGGASDTKAFTVDYPDLVCVQCVCLRCLCVVLQSFGSVWSIDMVAA